MRGWNKLIILGALLSVMLIISVVFSSGVVDVLTLPSGGSPESSPLSSSTPEVFVDPSAIIKDYLNDPDYQIGDTFQVDVNVTEVTDLFSWQINVSCNPSILNVSNIIAGEFLNRVTPPNYTTSSAAPNGLGFVINVTDNAMGYTVMGESILGGVPGVSGNGTLVTIVFGIVGYGCTDLTIISACGDLPTTLLNSTLDSMAFTKTGGYFRNKLEGDADGNGAVGILDILKVKHHWYPGPPAGAGGYDRNVDIDDNGAINILDILKVKANWGRGPVP